MNAFQQHPEESRQEEILQEARDDTTHRLKQKVENKITYKRRARARTTISEKCSFVCGDP